MKKPKKPLTKWQRIGRNNKNRGRAFERRVAKALRWTRVPYSGAVKDWGKADVVDGFYARKGYWAAECKTQPYGNYIRVEKKWIDQTLANQGRNPILITQQNGSSVAYVMLPWMSWLFLCGRAENWELAILSGTDCVESIGKSGGWKFPRPALDCLALHDAILVTTQSGVWVITRLDKFASVIHKHDIMIEEPNDV